MNSDYLPPETPSQIQMLGIQINFEKYRVFYWNTLTNEQKKALLKHSNSKDNSFPKLKTEEMFNLVNKESGGIEVSIAKAAKQLKLITTSDLNEILMDLGYGAKSNELYKSQTFNPDLPFWNATKGKLYFKGKKACSLQLRENYSNTQQVLEAFQKEGWPNEIHQPFEDFHSKAKDVVKYLNQICNGIKFYSHQKGKFLSWKTN
jgi:hypothetical protein